MNNLSRSPAGTSIAELPVTLWVFIFFLLLPLIDFAAVGCRSALAYFCLRDATYQAALQSTFTLAQSTAPSVLASDAASWAPGSIVFDPTQITVYVVSVDGTTATASSSMITTNPVPSSDAGGVAITYLIRVTATAQVAPLVNLTGSPIGKIPGLTIPLNLQMTYQVASENPLGLNK